MFDHTYISSHLEDILVIDRWRLLKRPPGTVVEAPRAAHREADRRRLLEHLGDLPLGGRVDGEDHQPVRVEAVHVERPIADDELVSPGLDHPPLLIDHLAAACTVVRTTCAPCMLVKIINSSRSN